MRVLFDANVLLDVLLNRQPWVVDSSAVWALNDKRKIEGYIAASTFTDIYYIARRSKDKDIPSALQAVQICITAFDICTVDKSTIVHASTLAGTDFEDNVLIACAGFSHMDAIVTRNPVDFQSASTPVHTPATLLQLLQADDTDAPHETRGRLENIEHKGISARLASILLHLASEQGENEIVGLTPQDLAESVGTYRETAMQVLEDLKSQGLIEMGHKRILIIDKKQLTEIADS